MRPRAVNRLFGTTLIHRRWHRPSCRISLRFCYHIVQNATIPRRRQQIPRNATIRRRRQQIIRNATTPRHRQHVARNVANQGRCQQIVRDAISTRRRQQIPRNSMIRRRHQQIVQNAINPRLYQQIPPRRHESMTPWKDCTCCHESTMPSANRFPIEIVKRSARQSYRRTEIVLFAKYAVITPKL